MVLFVNLFFQFNIVLELHFPPCGSFGNSRFNSLLFIRDKGKVEAYVGRILDTSFGSK